MHFNIIIFIFLPFSPYRRCPNVFFSNGYVPYKTRTLFLWLFVLNVYYPVGFISVHRGAMYNLLPLICFISCGAECAKTVSFRSLRARQFGALLLLFSMSLLASIMEINLIEYKSVSVMTLPARRLTADWRQCSESHNLLSNGNYFCVRHLTQFPNSSRRTLTGNFPNENLPNFLLFSFCSTWIANIGNFSLRRGSLRLWSRQ